ncbi:hypothetical protein EHQ68_09355 [Leptospira congkakensis]|uniref:Lipoprotein n=1 Tax=Leptospira congkakensis TaxID=2484932 RepID=A0A4Z1A507_9LEPT|nr:hypothetical protein [Leptospira congkakensis]TGL85964.1 hypothetical protein EHQ69_17950 [Leptospira congkakensis]TGL88837.1 hypothetical protein EHQ68_09355 [Leptospira congkakensis]TGL93342.1 hypothetical protein EHQ70_17520 [Leptospira congkakensis]
MFSIQLNIVQILFLVFVVLNFSCKSTTERLFDPKDSVDENKKTLIGFILFDETERKDVVITSSYAYLQALAGDNIELYEIEELDETKDTFKGSSTKSSFYYYEEEEMSYISYSYSPKKTMFNPSMLNGDKEYLIRGLKWVRSCGNNCSMNMNSRLNPFKSYKTLKIKGAPGEIVFLGIFTIKTKVIPSSTSLFSNSSSFTIEFNQILDNSEFYQRKIEPDQEKQIFDLKFGKNHRSAEIRFLQSIVDMQKTGFWYSKAKEKLKSLEK